MKNMEKVRLDSLLISADTTIKEAMLRLDKTAERIVFVVDKKRVILGTITDGDIRRGLIHGMKFSDKVSKIMHRDYITVGNDASDKYRKVRSIMLENEIEQIPVVDEKKRIVDLIVWTDIFGDKPAIERSFNNPVVIMAGGKGARLEPFTRILPKPLIPIGEKTIVEIIMEKFSLCGFKNFIFTLNYKKEYIKLFFKENKFPYSIDWVEEPESMGTAGSLSLLNDKIKDTFIVSNCDILVEADYADVLKWHKENGNLVTLIGCHKEVEIPYGILEMNNGTLKRFIEKPNYDVLINTGLYVLEPEVISLIRKPKFMDMNHLIDLASKKGKVSVYPVHGGWFDLGQWEEYNKTVAKLKDASHV